MNAYEELSDYERMREKNFEELEAFMCTLDDSELDRSIKTLESLTKEPQIVTKSNKKRKRKSDNDQTFRFTGQLPLYSRKSARLSNIVPQYTYTDLEDEDEVLNKKYHGNLSDLENIISRPRKSYTPRHPDPVFVPVEEITDDYIANIAERVIVKTYSQNGTSCHQCRQKTLDSKTYCRSGHCVGVRGQFCGVCLRNRYGEDAAVALKDPNWACPPCRGLCNCSICRTREGKCPTGMLAPIAFRHGHKSVKDFLLSLKGEGDYVHKAPIKTVDDKCNPSDGESDYCLLGFDSDLNPVWIARGLFNDGGEDDLLGFNKHGETVLTRKYF